MNRKAKVLSLNLIACISVFSSVGADEWKWRRIAWEGMKVWSAVSPPDSGRIVYVSICEGSDRGVHKSEDGGYSWRFLSESETYFADMLSVNPENQSELYCGSWSISDSPGTWPKRSRDAGSTWEEIERPLNYIVSSPYTTGLLLATETHSFRYTLNLSDDDGESWQRLSSSEYQFFNRHMSERVIFHSIDTTLVFAGYFMPNGVPYGLGCSRDAGYNWELVVQGEIAAFDDDPNNSDHWVAVVEPDGPGDPALCVESIDNFNAQESWELPDSIVWIEQIMFDLHDSDILYLVDNWSAAFPEMNSKIERKGVFRSRDSGKTWESMNTGLLDPTLITRLIRFQGRPGEIFAAAEDGLWLWTDLVSTSENSFSRPVGFTLDSISPCPFLDRVSARIIVERHEMISARIYDIRGLLIRSIFDVHLDIGEYTFRWDGRSENGAITPPGSYIISLRNGTDVLNRKVIKLR